MSKSRESNTKILPPIKKLQQYTGNLRQLASVRALRMEDGAEGNQRASALSTGGGLDMWVLPDRSMDIGPLWWRGMPLAWQHPNGFVPPARHSPYNDDNTGIERSLSGFLVTCGYDSVRRSGAGLPLHGSHTLTPARVTRQLENWDLPEPSLICEAEWVCAHLNQPSYRVQRRITAPIGGSCFSLQDRVENIGLLPAPLDTLYHFNLGFPAVQGKLNLTVGNDRVNLEPLQSLTADDCEPTVHCFRADAAARLVTHLQRPVVDGWPALDMTLTSYSDQLPWLQVWVNPRAGQRILALEPASSERSPTGESIKPRELAPGESRKFKLEIAFNNT